MKKNMSPSATPETTVPSKEFERRMVRIQLIGFIGVPVVSMLILLCYLMWKMNG